MKVYRDGKEVKNANISYFAGGQPAHVEVDGVNYDPSAFEFKDEETGKKTADAKKDSKRTKKQAKNSSVMTTQDV